MRRSPRALVAGGLLIVAVLGFLVYQGISNNLVYYQYPSELLKKGQAANGESLRLGGQVRPGSVQWNPQSQMLRFVIQDPKAHIAVVSHGLPPQDFRPGQGVVVQGTYHEGLFSATDLMVKHSNVYRAPKPGQTPVPDNYINQASS